MPDVNSCNACSCRIAQEPGLLSRAYGLRTNGMHSQDCKLCSTAWGHRQLSAHPACSPWEQSCSRFSTLRLERLLPHCALENACAIDCGHKAKCRTPLENKASQGMTFATPSHMANWTRQLLTNSDRLTPSFSWTPNTANSPLGHIPRGGFVYSGSLKSYCLLFISRPSTS